MKVAFWNINFGETSFSTRAETFTTWCEEIEPDILLLEEVGNTLLNPTSILEKYSKMTYVNHVNTLNKNDEETTKNLALLTKPGVKVASVVIQFPTIAQKRALIKTTINGIVLWVIHANASKTGGEVAVANVADHLSKVAGQDAVVGGDFNCPIDANCVPPNVVHPLAWDGSQLKFTQWNKTGDDSTSLPAPNLHLSSKGALIYQKFLPHKVIDYVIFGTGRTVTALKNCKTETTWKEILKDFDHCPVVYDIN